MRALRDVINYRLYSKYQDKIKLDYVIPDSLDKKSSDLVREVHIAIKKITSDVENEFQFNTVVSKYRELTNAIYEYIRDENDINFDVLSFALITLLKLISPVVVFMSEEIYSSLGGNGSIHNEPWPVYDEAKTKQNNIMLIVQVNGKIRDKIETTAGQTNDELSKLALSSEKTKQFLEGLNVIKTIVVPDKIVNIVAK